jgi:hypothetical protein
MTQLNDPSRSRNPIARRSEAMSAQSERTAFSCSAPGFSVTMRKIAARVRPATTGCGTGDATMQSSGINPSKAGASDQTMRDRFVQ